MHSVHRYHDICAGHRVHGHESKCQHLHGHNYRIHFTCEAEDDNLDKLGRVIDFSQVKALLCMWLEDNWDHKFLHWENDPIIQRIQDVTYQYNAASDLESDEKAIRDIIYDSLIAVPFNPTAENMAEYLVEVIGPKQLAGTGILLTKVLIEETAKCHASYEKTLTNEDLRLLIQEVSKP